MDLHAIFFETQTNGFQREKKKRKSLACCFSRCGFSMAEKWCAKVVAGPHLAAAQGGNAVPGGGIVAETPKAWGRFSRQPSNLGGLKDRVRMALAVEHTGPCRDIVSK